jgi:hypothetical protein
LGTGSSSDVRDAFFTAGAAALILTGSATIASAQTGAQTKLRSATPDFTVKSDFSANPKGVQFNAAGSRRRP